MQAKECLSLAFALASCLAWPADYDPEFDFNSDGRIDSKDLFFLALNWDEGDGTGSLSLLSMGRHWHGERDETPSPTPWPTPTPLPTYIVMLPGSIPMPMVQVPAGSFGMGSNDSGDWGQRGLQQPVHIVSIREPFHIAKTELTEAQWEAVTAGWPGEDPDRGPGYPTSNISWEDITGPGGLLDRINSLGLGSFRLPSEAEWEYCCRAETRTRFSFGDSSCSPSGCAACDLSDHGWWCGNSRGSGPKEVAQKPSSRWGLFDVHGNLYEWCQDDYHTSYIGAPTDGSPWIDDPPNTRKIVRGGCWDNSAGFCTSTARVNFPQDSRNNLIGFRLVRSVEP